MHGTMPIRSTYKTAKELGFTQQQFDALAWFVDQYDAGQIEDLPEPAVYSTRPVVIVPLDYFYMSSICVDTSCGTAGCIYGWINKLVPASIATWPTSARNLFMHFPPETRSLQARDATIRVLRGEPAWG